MTKKKMTKIFLLTTLLISGRTALGGTEGHGDGGIVCRHSRTTHGVTIETLDLWQGQKHGLHIERTNRIPIDDQVQKAIVKLALHLNMKGASELLNFRMNTVWNSAQFIRSKDFPVPNDTGLDVSQLPSECSLVGLARYRDIVKRDPSLDAVGPVYYDADILEINLDIYEKLSNTDIAALKLHETLYKMLREGTGLVSKVINDSLEIQRMVAILFSNEGFDTSKWLESNNNLKL